MKWGDLPILIALVCHSLHSPPKLSFLPSPWWHSLPVVQLMEPQLNMFTYDGLGPIPNDFSVQALDLQWPQPETHGMSIPNAYLLFHCSCNSSDGSKTGSDSTVKCQPRKSAFCLSAKLAEGHEHGSKSSWLVIVGTSSLISFNWT